MGIVEKPLVLPYKVIRNPQGVSSASAFFLFFLFSSFCTFAPPRNGWLPFGFPLEPPQTRGVSVTCSAKRGGSGQVGQCRTFRWKGDGDGRFEPLQVGGGRVGERLGWEVRGERREARGRGALQK